MHTRYKLCTAITVLNWIEIPLVIIMLILDVSVMAAAANGTVDPTESTFVTGIGFLGVVFLLAVTGIASLVCSIILLVKNDSTSPNSGLTIAVGVCGIVFPLANLVIGIILCNKLKHEGYSGDRSAPY